MTARSFKWQTEGRFGGDEVEHVATLDGDILRWATVADFDDDQPFTREEKTQALADFLAEGPVEAVPIRVLDELALALAKTPAWLEPLRLQIAAREGDLTATRGLLRIGGAHKDIVVRGATPLSAALEAEQLETAGALLHARCDPKVRIANGATALHVAARNAKTAASAAFLQQLIDAGAELDARNADGQTPLVFGLTGHLCKEGVQILLEDPRSINVAANDGTTPLLAEARGWCRPSVVRILLGARADVNARTQDGWSTLLWAITKHDLWLVKLLIEAKADVNVIGQPHTKTHHNVAAAPQSALALAESLAAAAAAAPEGAQAALKGKAADLAAQIVQALKSAGAR